MPSHLRRRGPGGRTRLDSTVGRHPTIRTQAIEQSPMACIPQLAVESSRRGVASQTHVRRWPRTTRCNGRAVIVMRGGEPVGRGPLIAPFWIPGLALAKCLFSRTLGDALHETPAMTSAVRDLLRSFQSLSDAEKHEAAGLLLREVVQGEAGDIGDDALVAVAEELFLDLDARETGDGQSSPR